MELWAEHGSEIAAILEAIDKLEREDFLVWQSTRTPRNVVAEEILGIDLAELDTERRAVLGQKRIMNEREQHRKMNDAQKSSEANDHDGEN